MTPLDPDPFHVEYDIEATNGLVEAYAAYFPSRSGRRVTQAERILAALLEDDPENNGKHHAEGLYRIVVSPLVAFYVIHEAARVVRVIGIGYFKV